MNHAWLAVLLLPAACASYEPPVAGDHGSPKYKIALAKCHQLASTHARQAANATPSSAVRALFTSDDAEHQEELSCMASRGYRPL